MPQRATPTLLLVSALAGALLTNACRRGAAETEEPDETPTEVVDIHVYIDNVFAGGFGANRNRGDVAAAFPTAGALHGFDVTFPVSPGSHNICVHALDTAGGAKQLRCTTVDVPTP